MSEIARTESGSAKDGGRDRSRADAAVDAIRTHVTQVYEENRQLKAALADAGAEIEAQRAELKRLHEAAVLMERAADELREDCTSAMMEHAQRSTWLPLDGLLTAFTELERAGDWSAVLGHLVTALSREFSRVAVCGARRDTIEMVHHVGFERDETLEAAMTRKADSIITRAFSSADMQIALPGTDDAAAALLPFGGTPACAVAIPFTVGAAVVAVVYADDSDVPEFSTSIPHARIKFAELLRRHANLLIARAVEREDVVVPMRLAR